MRTKPVFPRERASQDVDATLAWYLKEGGPSVALDFVDALERAYTDIGRHPGTSSPRYAHEPELPRLRAWSLSRYPYGTSQDSCRLIHATNRPIS
ncbi:type II toxin-antitoxin system RelE/ParE family toxin, partial [Thauera sp.]|uniref:type II toxin-antitoxin system RelE/ParE family toxin n=1 Tax=Thauera sp. TaxID=1905334 RepID=UPI002B80D3AA